jgi:hypothetical protein
LKSTKKHAVVANKKIKIMPIVARNVFLELAPSIDQVQRSPDPSRWYMERRIELKYDGKLGPRAFER